MQRPWPKSKYEACHALSDVTTDNAPPVVDGIVRTEKLIRVLTICTNAGVLLLGQSCGLSSRRTRKHQRPKLEVHLFVSYMTREADDKRREVLSLSHALRVASKA